MKNTITKILAATLLIICFSHTNSFAQGDAYQQGAITVGVGYGFPNIYKDVFNIYNIEPGYTSSGFGPIHLKGDYAITDKFSLGLDISYFSFKNSWSEPFGTDSAGNPQTLVAGWKGDALSFLIRANYHFLTSDKFDPYVGLGVGYSDWSFTYSDNSAALLAAQGAGGFGSTYSSTTLSFPGFAFEASVGCRYYVAPSFAIWAEVGYGVDIAQIGVNMKFGGNQ